MQENRSAKETRLELFTGKGAAGLSGETVCLPEISFLFWNTIPVVQIIQVRKPTRAKMNFATRLTFSPTILYLRLKHGIEDEIAHLSTEIIVPSELFNLICAI